MHSDRVAVLAQEHIRPGLHGLLRMRCYEGATGQQRKVSWGQESMGDRASSLQEPTGGTVQ